MGHDEHGPAYPEPPTMAEFARVRAQFENDADRVLMAPPSRLWFGICTAVVLALAALLWSIWPAHAMDHGFDKTSATSKWMEAKIMPDNPPASCCAKSDAYPVDRYEKLPNGDYRAWVENGDAITFPDGSKRAPWDIKVPLIIPKSKVNPEEDDLDNPTEHGWAFFRPATGSDHEVGSYYCFVRHPQGF